MDYTIPELMTCIIARELENDDKVAVGLNAELFLLATFLAQKLYVPNLKIRHGLSFKKGELNPAAWTSDINSNEFHNFEYYEQHDEILKMKNNEFCNVFFISGMQIDKFGNTNLIGIKDKDGNIKIRGPGSIGTSAIAQLVDKYYIFTFEHSKRRLVERCDFVSAIGYNIRKNYGLKGGPMLLITPLCIFDFIDGEAKLRSIHPHSSLKNVQSKTGFDFDYGNYYITKKPTRDELKFIRKFDKKNILKDFEALVR